MGWGETKNAYHIFVEKSIGKQPLL